MLSTARVSLFAAILALTFLLLSMLVGGREAAAADCVALCQGCCEGSFDCNTSQCPANPCGPNSWCTGVACYDCYENTACCNYCFPSCDYFTSTGWVLGRDGYGCCSFSGGPGCPI